MCIRDRLSITFEIGTDLDMANVLVQNRVAAAEPGLPEDVKRQGVTTKKKSNETTLFIAVYSPGEQLDALFLQNFSTLQLLDPIKRVNGVGDVTIFGAGDYGMRIWLDPDRIVGLGLSIDQVLQAVREQNVEVAAGQIGQPPAPPGQAFQYSVNTRGRLVTPEEFGDIVIKIGEEGRMVRLHDVARIEQGSSSYRMSSTYNGEPCAVIAVYQLPGANAIEVADGVVATLDELRGAFPEGMDLSLIHI